MNKRVEGFYDGAAVSEWERLSRHRMEFETTALAFREFLHPGSKILDVGAGPGRYSIELAKQGHLVTLLDLSAANVELARQKAEELGVHLLDFVHGDALDLSAFGERSFDAVLLMGPLYHLVDAGDRDRAIKEALRVLRPGGLFFAAFITRYAVYIDMLRAYPGEIGRFAEAYRRLMDEAVHIPNARNPGFTDAHFAHPMDIEPLMRRHGLETLRLAVAEGLIAAAEDTVNALPEEAFQEWVQVCYSLGTDPITWGAGEHMLYVGRKG